MQWTAIESFSEVIPWPLERTDISVKLQDSGFVKNGIVDDSYDDSDSNHTVDCRCTLLILISV